MLNNLTLELLPLAWDLGSFFKNAAERAKEWGGAFLVLIGIIAVIVAVYQIVSGLISDRKQISWLKVIALLFIGGALIAGGWGFVASVADGGSKTINELGNMILPLR